METSVEQLIKDRTFASLTSEELESVKELCETEEEFQTMKRFFQELETVSVSHKTIINPEVKNSLDGIFHSKYPGIRANWTAPETVAAPAAPIIPLHQRTWVRVAAIALLVLGTAPFWNMLKTDVPTKGRPLTARATPPQKDTTPSEASPGKTVSSPSVEEQHVVTHTSAEGEDLQFEVSAEPAIASAERAFSEEGAKGADVPTATYLWTAAPNDRTDRFTSGSKDKDLTGGLNGTYGVITNGATTTYGFSSQLSPATDGYYRKSDDSDEDLKGLADFGMNADLNPNGAPGEGRMDNMTCSLAEQPDDLLDLLVPAF